MKKLVLFITAVLILSMSLVACTPTQPTKSVNQIAMIIPIPKGDPFITLSYRGLEKLAEEQKLEPKLIEALDKSEYSEQIRAMSEQGANPIYVMWDDLAAEVLKIAKDFPNTKYIIVDTYATADLNNVKTIAVEPQEASFIAGVVAANLTETKRVAFVGSMQMPVIDRFRAGFEAGVKYVNNGTVVESLYVGSADDPTKASELTKQLIGKGADVVMHAANKAGLGVIQAAEQMNVKAIGVDDWQGDLGKTVVWSALKDITGATYNAGKSVFDGIFKSGVEVFDINSGIALYDARDYDKLSPEVKAIVDEVVKKLKSGEITVPTEIQK
jgi:basic membrane protein A